MASHTVIDGVDFGVPTNVLRDKIDIFETPVEALEARKGAPTPKQVESAPKKTRGTAMEAMKEEVKTEETAPEKMDVVFNEETYSVIKPEDWDIDISEAIEDRDFIIAVRAMMSPKAWLKFKTKNRSKSAAVEFLVAVAEAAGLDEGE